MEKNPNCSQKVLVSDDIDWNFLDDIIPIHDLWNSDMAPTASIISNAHFSFANDYVTPCMPEHEIEWSCHNTIELENNNNGDSESVLIQESQSNQKVTRRTRGKRRRRSYGVSWSFVEKNGRISLPAEEGGGRHCTHCLTEETPQWRRGPMGPNTLCNACGVKFRKGKLVPEYRPAKSPTFDPSLHSNSTKKLLKTRAAYAQDSCIG
ncbi:hypothetical protein SUGI_0322120 [Cryptomeria japonica]|nr:hypothetical protein SUGI_0322120 [Cryptomeria japonica]